MSFCRDVKQNVDIEMKMQHFLSSIRNPSNKETLLYGKNHSCPEKWRETIMEKIPPPVVAYGGPTISAKPNLRGFKHTKAEDA